MPKEQALIFCADLHLLTKVPVARLDADIMDTQASKLKVISDLSDEFTAPVIIAGDVFDHWRSSLELLDFAFDNLPKDVYSIAGNHDLMHHSMTNAEKTGLGLLCKIERVKKLDHNNPTEINGVRLHGFSYGEDVLNCPNYKNNTILNVAILHRFVSPDKQVWQDVKEEAGLQMLSGIEGYDLIVTGDCHQPFVGKTPNGTWVINPGSVLRKTAAQLEHKPRVYVWYPERKGSKAIEVKYLPINKGVVTRSHLDIVNERKKRIKIFADKLKTKTNISLDFKQNILNRMAGTDDICKETEQLIMRHMEVKTK